MKMICFDIDGTLISGGSQLICESAGEAIKAARQNGHICVINTGRTKKLVGPEITGQVTFDGLLLGCGTEVIYREQVLLHKTFSKEMSLRIMDSLQRYEIDAVLEGAEDNFCEEPEKMHTETFRNYARNLKQVLGSDRYTKMMYAPGNFDKFYAYADKWEQMNAFRREFETELSFIDRENGYFEVVPKGYSKASAIRFLADRLQLPMEETVAIGDSNNDLSMLECAGTSIAMGNSSGAVLDMADYVTTDVDRDGIWNALKWLGVLDA